MKLLKLLPNLDYPCTINFNVTSDDEYIPVEFSPRMNFPRRYDFSDIAFEFSEYFGYDVVLFEELSTDRKYRIDVFK